MVRTVGLLSSVALSAGGADMVINSVLRPQLVYPLQFTSVTEHELDRLEWPVRRLWLHRHGLAQSADRSKVALPLEMGGMQWRSLWDEINVSRAVLALKLLNGGGSAGRQLAAAVFHHAELQATAREGAGYEPPTLGAVADNAKGVVGWWLGALARWLHVQDLTVCWLAAGYEGDAASRRPPEWAEQVLGDRFPRGNDPRRALARRRLVAGVRGWTLGAVAARGPGGLVLRSEMVAAVLHGTAAASGGVPTAGREWALAVVEAG